MTWIASWQPGVQYKDPVQHRAFATEAEGDAFAAEHNRKTGQAVTVWELGDEEGLG